MRVTFISPVQKQARIERRINNIVDELKGAEFKLLYYERDYYGEDDYGIESESLGKIDHGKYYLRFFKIIKNIPKIRGESKSTDIFYVFGMDLLLIIIISNFFKKKFKVAYEIADLGTRTSNSIKYKIVNMIENWLLRYVDVLVLTSSEYLKYYKSLKNFDKCKYFVMENKIDPKKYIKINDIQLNNGEKITIGYFGILRSKYSLDLLLDLANVGGNKIQILLAGKFLGTEDYIDKLNCLKNIEYFGTYKSPTDLPYLYNKIHLSWLAHKHPNSKYMRTNRFYEACFYKKPMITQIGTADGNIVEDKYLGLSIDMNKMQDTINQILDIDTISYKKWTKNIANLPPNIYSYTNEHKRLLDLIIS